MFLNSAKIGQACGGTPNVNCYPTSGVTTHSCSNNVCTCAAGYIVSSNQMTCQLRKSFYTHAT